MVLNKQIDNIIKDPEIYYSYFSQQYEKLLVLSKSVTENGYDLEQQTSVKLALLDALGKLSIAMGALNGMREEVLIAYWNGIEKQRARVGENPDSLKKYEEAVLKVGKSCM